MILCRLCAPCVGRVLAAPDVALDTGRNLSRPVPFEKGKGIIITHCCPFRGRVAFRASGLDDAGRDVIHVRIRTFSPLHGQLSDCQGSPPTKPHSPPVALSALGFRFSQFPPRPSSVSPCHIGAGCARMISELGLGLLCVPRLRCVPATRAWGGVLVGLSRYSVGRRHKPRDCA